MPEMRKDPVTGRWVIIAPGRARRPTDFAGEEFVGETFTHQPSQGKPSQSAPSPIERSPAGQSRINHQSQNDDPSCAFCEGNESHTPPEIVALRSPALPQDSPGWSVRVVPNKFPALGAGGSLELKSEGMLSGMDGVGAHEVIIESPDHYQTMATMPEEQVGQVLRIFAGRMLDLQRDKRVRYVLIFKNQGPRAGATFQHPHSQLVALPVVPREVIEELRGAQDYFRLKEHCVFCDLLQQELDSGIRVIDQNKDFVTLAPYASRFPFEACILPRRHASAFETSSPRLMAALARSVKTLLAKLDSALHHPAFNLVIHTAPHEEGQNGYYHWHIEVMPRLSKIGGFELGTGFYINFMPPEEAAGLLREPKMQIPPPGE